MNKILVVSTVSAGSSLAPLLTGLASFRRLRFELKILLALFAVAAFVDVYTYIKFFSKTNVHWIHHLYSPIEYSLLATVFSFWQASGAVKKALFISIPIFIAVCVVNMLIPGRIYTLNDLTESLACTIYVIISVYTLYTIQKSDNGALANDPRFWIITALLLYSAGGLSYFAFHSIVTAGAFIWILFIHAALNVMANILYSMGLVRSCRP